MMFNVPVAISGSGFGAPSGFILAGIVLIVFAIGYVAMARRVTAAGGFYSCYRPASMLVAPLIGGLAMIGGAYLLVASRDALAGASHNPCAESIPYVVLLVFLAGIGLGLYYRKFRPDHYQGVGRFVHHHVGEGLPVTSPATAAD